jgi:hypothetical protein
MGDSRSPCFMVRNFGVDLQSDPIMRRLKWSVVILVAFGVFCLPAVQKKPGGVPAVGLILPTKGPQSVPQMTNSTDCESQNPLTWVCRDGYTLTASDSGKLHLYRLGSTDHRANILHAVIRR